MAFFHTAPQEPGFGTLLGQGVGQGIQQQLGKFFQERDEEKKRTKILDRFTNLPQNASFEQKLMALSGLDEPELKKGLATIEAQKRLQQEKEQTQRSLLKDLGFLEGEEQELTSEIKSAPQSSSPKLPTDEQILGLSLVNPQLANQYRQLKDSQEKIKREEEEAARAHQAYKAQGLPVPPEHVPGTPKSVYDKLAGIKPSPAEEKRTDLQKKGEGYLKTIDELRDLLKHTGPLATLKAGMPGQLGKWQEKQAQFDVLAFSLEGFLREMAAKGQLPKAIFNTLLKKLPDARLPQATNIGRLNAIESVIKRYFDVGEAGSPEEQFEEVIMITPEGRRVGAKSPEQLELFLKHGAKRI